MKKKFKITRREKNDHFLKWKKPNVNDISVKLGLNDRLCIKNRNEIYTCMSVKDWLEKNPLAVLIENVVHNGPNLRKEVYTLFLKKVGNFNISEARRNYWLLS